MTLGKERTVCARAEVPPWSRFLVVISQWLVAGLAAGTLSVLSLEGGQNEFSERFEISYSFLKIAVEGMLEIYCRWSSWQERALYADRGTFLLELLLCGLSVAAITRRRRQEFTILSGIQFALLAITAGCTLHVFHFVARHGA